MNSQTTMAKPKIILLAAIFMLSITACSGESGDSSVSASDGNNTPTMQEATEIETSTITPAAIPEAQALALGEAVKTDILEVTLYRADLAIALNSRSTTANPLPIDIEYLLPKEYNAESDNKNPFVANKGHTLIAITYSATNLDRSTIDFRNSDFLTIAVEYKGESYSSEVEYRLENITGDGWTKKETSNVLLQAGESSIFRCYVDIPVEVDSLDDSFNIILSVPDTGGNTVDFTYSSTVETRIAGLETWQKKLNAHLEEAKEVLISKQWKSVPDNGENFVFYADGKAEYITDSEAEPIQYEVVYLTEDIIGYKDSGLGIRINYDEAEKEIFYLRINRDFHGTITTLTRHRNDNFDKLSVIATYN